MTNPTSECPATHGGNHDPAEAGQAFVEIGDQAERIGGRRGHRFFAVAAQREIRAFAGQRQDVGATVAIPDGVAQLPDHVAGEGIPFASARKRDARQAVCDLALDHLQNPPH